MFILNFFSKPPLPRNVRSVRPAPLHFHLPGALGHRRSEHEIVQLAVIGMQNIVLGAFPPFLPLMDKNNVFADLHHRVHVVRVDDRRDVVFLGDLLDQVVDQHRRHRIEPRVRLVAEQVLRIQHDGAGDRHALDHPAADFGRVQMVHVAEVDPFQAKIHPVALLAHAHRREQVERQPHVLLDVRRVEQRASLENHADLLADRLALLERQPVKTNVVIVDIAAVDLMQPDKRLEQYGLSGTALSDNQVGDSGSEVGGNVVQHHASVERLYDMFGSNHAMSKVTV